MRGFPATGLIISALLISTYVTGDVFAQAIPPWWHVLPGSGIGCEDGNGSNYGGPGPYPCGGSGPSHGAGDVRNDSASGGAASAGNPIDSLGGSPQLIITDAAIPANGPVPMIVARSYHNGGLSESHWRGEGLLGPTWFMNWEEHLSIEGSGLETSEGDPLGFAAGSAVWIETAAGGVVASDDDIIVHVDPLGVRTRYEFFATTVEGDVYHPVLVPQLARGRLVDTGAEYELELADGTIKTFNRRGHLTRIEDTVGRAVDLIWETIFEDDFELYFNIIGGTESPFPDRVARFIAPHLSEVTDLAPERAAWLGGSLGDPIVIHVQKEILREIQVEGDTRALHFEYTDPPGDDVAILNNTPAVAAAYSASMANWGGVTRDTVSVNGMDMLRQLYLESFGTRYRVQRIDLYDQGTRVSTLAELGYGSATDDTAVVGEWPNGYGVELNSNGANTLIIADRRLIRADWWPEYPGGDPDDPGVTNIATRWDQSYVYGTASPLDPEAYVDLTNNHTFGIGDNVTTLSHVLQARLNDMDQRETYTATAYQYGLNTDPTFPISNPDTGWDSRVLVEYKRDPNTAGNPLFEAYTFGINPSSGFIEVRRGEDLATTGLTSYGRAPREDGGGIQGMRIYTDSQTVRHIDHFREDVDGVGDLLTYGVTLEVRRENATGIGENIERHTEYEHANLITLADWWRHGRISEVEEYHLESSTDPVRTMVVEYDSSAHGPSRIVRPDGTETVFAYNTDRTVQSVTVRRAGDTSLTMRSQFTYSTTAPGLVETVTDPLGNATTYTHSAVTGLTTRIDGEYNSYVRIYYDPTLSGAIDPLGRVFATEQGYVSGGTTDVPEQRTLFAYEFDANPTLVTQITEQNLVDAGAVDRVTELFYDSEEQLASVIDPADEGTIYRRNCLGQVIEVQNSIGGVWEYEFDSWGRQIAMEDPLNRRHEWELDFADRVTRFTRPDGVYTSYTYGPTSCGCNGMAASNISQLDLCEPLDPQSPDPLVDTLLRRVEFSYSEPFGLLELTSWNDDLDDLLGENVRNTYQSINFSPSGDQWQRALTSVEDQALGFGDGTVSFQYDEQGHVIQVIEPDGAAVSYEYDDYHRVERVIDPDGNVTEYGWDTDGTLARVSNGFGQETLYAYDPNSGRLQTVVHQNGSSISYDYNGWGQVETITHWNGEATPNVIASYTYAYDDTGLPESVEFEDGRWVELEHDGIGQLIRETWRADDDSELWSRLYDYDLAGNRTEVTLIQGNRTSPVDSETTTYQINDLDQIVSDGSAAYSYDFFGNLTDITTSSEIEWRFEYDPRTDAMTSAMLVNPSIPMEPLHQVEMISDPLGRRILRRAEDGASTRYFYDGFNLLLEREIHPTRIQLYDDFHRAAIDGSWNTPSQAQLGSWAPYEAYAGGLPDPPYPSTWNGYYRLDGLYGGETQNMVLIYGSGPSDDPVLPHSPPMFNTMAGPVEDPFVWSGVDPQTVQPTYRLVAGMRDADGDALHDPGTDEMWALALRFSYTYGIGVEEEWSFERWSPTDSDWTTVGTPLERFNGSLSTDPQGLFAGFEINSDIPSLTGSRLTAYQLDGDQWVARMSTDLSEQIPEGSVGFQAEMPFSGQSTYPYSRTAGGTPVWIRDWGCFAEMVLLDDAHLQEGLYEDNEGASPEASYLLVDGEPTGATLTAVYDADHLSTVMELSGYVSGDHGQTSAMWHDELGHILTFQFRAEAGTYLGVQVYTDVDHDGSLDVRYLNYHFTSGTDSTNAPDHTLNHIYLDPSLADGTWQVFSRDIRRDWYELTDGVSDVVDVQFIRWRGNMAIDNIRVGTAQTNRIHTNAPAALGGTISVREVDPETGENIDTWLHHDRMGSVILQTGEDGQPLASFPATGRVVEACSGTSPDPRWYVLNGSIALANDPGLAVFQERSEAKALVVEFDPGISGSSRILAGSLPMWTANPNDPLWAEEDSHVVSFSLRREAHVLMAIRGWQTGGDFFEISVRFGGGGDSTYAISGGIGVNHNEDVPIGEWGHVSFDVDEVVAAQYPTVEIETVDGIMIWGWGETRLADFALLGETHGAYSAYGESLASAQTGDVLSPMAQAAAWSRPDAGSTVGWQSKDFDPELGLHFNNARWYSPSLGRFTQSSPLGGTFEQPYGYGFNSPAAAFDINGLEGDELESGLNPLERLIRQRAESNLDMLCMGFGYGSLYDYAPLGYHEDEFWDIMFWGGITVGATYAVLSYWHGGAVFKALGSLRGILGTGRSFGSHRELVRALGPAGPGRAWHHIVPQSARNLGRFGAHRIHNTRNVVNISAGRGQLHNSITGFYNSINRNITGSNSLRIREWLESKSFRYQRRFGLRALRNIERGTWP